MLHPSNTPDAAGRGRSKWLAGVAVACAEGERGADWLSIAGLTDAGDAALSLLHPGVPARSRLMTIFTGAAGALHYVVARKTHEVVEPRRTVEV